MQSKPGLDVYALLALMPLFFVSNLVIGRAAVAEVEPWALAFWRWGLATAMLLPFAWTSIVAQARELRAAWGEILVLGFLGMVACGGVVYLGLKTTTATHGALIYAASSIAIVLLEAAAFKKPLSFATLLGAVVGFSGVAVIVLEGEVSRLWQHDFNVGDLLIAFSAFSWAVYSVILKRERLAEIATLPLFAMIALAGSALLVPFVLHETLTLNTFPQSAKAWSMIVAMAIFPSVLAFGLFQYGVKRVGPSVTGVYLYLLPLYGVALAWLTLGETFHRYHALGLVLVLAGVVLATGNFRKHTG